VSVSTPLPAGKTSNNNNNTNPGSSDIAKPMSTSHNGVEYRHARVPRTKDMKAAFSSWGGGNDFTTLMLRNIPNRYTQRQLLSELNSIGFAGRFDFLYLPVDRSTESSVGYSFINFLTVGDAQMALEVFGAGNGYRFQNYRAGTAKIGSVSVAHLQGLEANIAHYKKSVINSAKDNRFRPMVLPCGVQPDLDDPDGGLLDMGPIKSAPLSSSSWYERKSSGKGGNGKGGGGKGGRNKKGGGKSKEKGEKETPWTAPSGDFTTISY